MKKLLLIALCDINDLSNGVTLKVRAQINAFIELGFDVYSATYGKNSVIIKGDDYEKINIVRNKRRHALFAEIKMFLKSHEIDIAFIRYPHLDFLVMQVLRALKQKTSRIILEIPSFPIDYPKFSLTVKYFHLMDFINRHRLKRYVDIILAIGYPVDRIYGIPAISIPNGYLSKTHSVEAFSNNPNQIDILSLSSFYNTHGFDRLIEGMKIFTQIDEHNFKICFHLVGEGPEKESLINLVNSYHLENHIKFYSSMSHDEINKLYRFINMGCGSLAIHRLNYTYASPLKTKDYFQRGLPFFCAYDEISVESNYPYVCRFPSDDSPIDIHRLITFYQSYSQNIDMVIKEMQMYGEERFNWKNILKLGL